MLLSLRLQTLEEKRQTLGIELLTLEGNLHGDALYVIHGMEVIGISCAAH
jgi:hypothetical protein